MTAIKGSFDFCNAPVINGAQQIDGDFQCPYFANQIMDAVANVKNYSFSLNVVPDLLDANIALDETTAGVLAGGYIGVGGALEGLSIDAGGFLGQAGTRIGVDGTTHRVGYCNETVPPTAAYNAQGVYALSVNTNTYYWWIPSTNEINAKNGAQTILPGRKFLTQTNTVTLTGQPGKPVTASCVNRGFRDIYALNLCLVMIDWGAVVRQQIGSKQGIGGILYYPKVYLLLYASGYFLCTDVTLLQGAGNVDGGVTLDNSEGVITSINALTSAGPPVGSPSMFGNITPNERYDSISVSVAAQSGAVLTKNYGAVATCTGMTFDSLAPGTLPILGTGPTQGIFLEALQVPYQISADQKTCTVYLPANPSGYLTFRTTLGDVFTTRTKI
jgi:hypothetical protein